MKGLREPPEGGSTARVACVSARSEAGQGGAGKEGEEEGTAPDASFSLLCSSFGTSNPLHPLLTHSKLTLLHRRDRLLSDSFSSSPARSRRRYFVRSLLSLCVKRVVVALRSPARSASTALRFRFPASRSSLLPSLPLSTSLSPP